jgi:hypothetical protein
MGEQEVTRESFEFVGDIGHGGQAHVELWRLKSTGELFVWKRYSNPSGDMSDKIATEAGMFMGLDSPWLVRGYYFFLSTKPMESTVTVLEHMAGGRVAE